MSAPASLLSRLRASARREAMRPAIRRAMYRLSDEPMTRYLCFVADPDLARLVLTRARQEGLGISDTIRRALVATYKYRR